MTRPLNPARTITAPYVADHPPPMPERIRALLGRRAADLTRRELLDIAADAANRDPWDLCGDREHVGAICDLAGTLEAEIEALQANYAECVVAMRLMSDDAERHCVELESERKAHAETRDVLEAMLGAAAPVVLDKIDEVLSAPSGTLDVRLFDGPEPGPHDAITVDSALDDDDTRVATDEELRR